MAITQPVSGPPARRRLDVIPGGRSAFAGRAAAVRRAQEARRRLQPRHERFAHLKRSYD
jgi:hypothetical protein